MNIQELFDLRGRVALVTGAYAWLGKDVASVLAEAGASVIVTSRSAEKAEEAALQLKQEYGNDTLGLTMNQRQYASVQQMAEQAIAWKGKVDILVNNAGGGVGNSPGHLFKRSSEDIAAMIETNLTGVIYCCKAVAPTMVEAGYGKIINIASMAGLIGRDRRMYDRSGMNGQPVDYAAAKAGVIGLTRDLAGLLSPDGVYVNAISPGGFEKPGNLPEQFTGEFADATMLGRWGRMGLDLKGAALYLASPASDNVTAHNLVVDGGFSLWK
ncbi:SDR family NAD(P)-dependent oxidoreductase [Tunicatimonas pelagia]|uniref:SDR family NAD(P)-dependent oxidoreductase n=1 Tax=Tunicatimonas pelagia TaxID=931531 RepID=UPI002666B035|nr:SDR family NAD(P)-dependent oxidoreductase [Tunicatimonas pelagia]WKN44206.1 SDR family NAD(P)-dependent oxidoreductase [Tunicatimonas pelagia]